MRHILFLSVLFLFCLTANAKKDYVEIKTPSMVEFLKNWYGLEPNEKGYYSMDSLHRVYFYKVTELPLPPEFKYLRNLSNIVVFTSENNNILDFSPFEDIFIGYLEIKSLVKVKVIMGKQDRLKHLVLYSNCVGLDIKKCTNIERLVCFKNNKLEDLDLSNNLYLKYIDCDNNKLTSLDLRNNLYLEVLICSHNQLEYLDLSQNDRLKELDCSYNKFRSLEDLLLPKSVTHFYFSPCGNFRERPQNFYIDSFPNLEILQLEEIQIKVK